MNIAWTMENVSHFNRHLANTLRQIAIESSSCVATIHAQLLNTINYRRGNCAWQHFIWAVHQQKNNKKHLMNAQTDSHLQHMSPYKSSNRMSFRVVLPAQFYAVPLSLLAIGRPLVLVRYRPSTYIFSIFSPLGEQKHYLQLLTWEFGVHWLKPPAQIIPH